MQTFFVNGRPVRSRLLIAALEEAYRNQIMSGKFPACVLHLTLPANMVDVNVHPAKTEVKFLNEKAVFDCMHYGVLSALNRTPDRPQVQFKNAPASSTPQPEKPAARPVRQESFFRTMTAQEYKTFSSVISQAPQPRPEAATAAFKAVKQDTKLNLREQVISPAAVSEPEPALVIKVPAPIQSAVSAESQHPVEEQAVLPMPDEIPWRLVGELYRSYILVEQGEEAFLIDKHAAHERILFDRLKANQESISAQTLLAPVSCTLRPDYAAVLFSNTKLLDELGFEIEEFGDNTVLLRQIPMDLSTEDAADAIEALAADLMNGRRESRENVRDELLHTVACKAAIKAGWHTDEQELLALVKQVMAREDLKYCPHGRPICITLGKKQLEKQFKRT
jgi:DNA mismatch repair protein MutL